MRGLRRAGVALREVAPSAGRHPFDLSAGASARIDARGLFLGVSAAMARSLGFTPEALCGRSAFDLVHPQDVARATAALALLFSRGDLTRIRIRCKSADGTWRRTEVSAALVARARTTAQVAFHARHLDARPTSADQDVATLPSSDVSVPGAIVWDVDFKVVSWSAGAQALFGYAESEVIGKNAFDLLSLPASRIDTMQLRHAMDFQRSGIRVVSRAMTKGGQSIACEWYHAPVLDADDVPAGFASAVSRAREVERRERRVPLCDALTGLASNSVFFDRVERAIAAGTRAQDSLAVYFIDVDRFAAVNADLGHSTGDAVLREIAQRLSKSMRNADSLARLGGDKFVALSTGVGGKVGASAVAQRIVECFSEPFFVESDRLIQTASIGIALFPDDGRDAETLVRCAEIAMRGAKDLGRDAFQFHSQIAGMKNRGSLERDLRFAIERQEFRLHFQPQVDLRTGAICGAEALVRWQHPQRGLLMPGDFVPLAEETGLIVPIGSWILRSACMTMRSWNDAGVGIPRITVNVSGRELRRRLVDEVAQVLCDTDLDPNSLELELTETVTMRSSHAHPQLLDELKSFGVRLAVDDFGVGYSSLAYLQRFPVDTLKIDRLFVGDCLTNGVNAAIVQAIITMAHGMDLEVVAEGVESNEQSEHLRALGCDGAQGYLYGAPLPPDDFVKFVSHFPARAPHA